MKYFIVIIIALISLISCESQEQKKYTYVVVDKYTELGSHYNILTDKQAVSTDHIVVFKEVGTGRVVASTVSRSKYHSYEKGHQYTFYYELY